MKIEATGQEVEALWKAAEKASRTFGDDFAEGCYTMIQALTGNSSVEQLVAELTERAKP